MKAVPIQFINALARLDFNQVDGLCPPGSRVTEQYRTWTNGKLLNGSDEIPEWSDDIYLRALTHMRDEQGRGDILIWKQRPILESQNGKKMLKFSYSIRKSQAWESE